MVFELAAKYFFTEGGYNCVGYAFGFHYEKQLSRRTACFYRNERKLTNFAFPEKSRGQ